MTAIPKNAKYIGDGLYVNFDGFMFGLFAERYGEIHEVYLEDSVLISFLEFVQENTNVIFKLTKGES